MPPIPKKYFEQKAIKQKYQQGQWKIRWYCPTCGACHHYPFSDGCHRTGCDYKGPLKQG